MSDCLLEKVHEFSLSNIAVCDGLGVDAILLDDRYWDSIDAYCSTMALPVISKRQWGGYAEVVVLAFVHKVRAWMFAALPDGKVNLLCAPIGAVDALPISIV
jgi:hypothetical protein